MFAGLEGYTNEMIAVCVLISITAAFLYVYRKRVKSEYSDGKLGGGVFGNKKTVTKEKPKKQMNPQGTKNDYLQLVSALVSLARKKKWLIIAPAVMEKSGAYTQLAALIVTPQKIIGVCAFGHGGTIVAGGAKQDWTQRINDTEYKISSPLKSIENAQTIVSGNVQALGLQGRTVEVFGAYTHPHAVLQGAATKTCYTAKDFVNYLENKLPAANGSEDSKETMEQLRTVVIKPEKAPKRK